MGFLRSVGLIGGASKDGWVSCYATILGFFEHKCEVSMLPTPACSFDSCNNLCNLLLEMINGVGCGLLDYLTERNW